MADSLRPGSNDDELIYRRLDNQLSEEEFALLDERLRSDSAFRERFVRMVDLDACLYDEFSETALADASVRPMPKGSSFRLSSAWSAWAVVTALIVLLVCYLSVRDYDGKTANADPRSGADHRRPIDSSSSMLNFVADGSVNAESAAVLVMAQGDFSDQFVPGHRFKPGTLKLTEGYVQLEFVCGAVVGLNGPAELQIQSKDAARILSGQIAAHVPDRARGFVLNAPSAAIVDLGTDFSVRIDKTGDAEVAVQKGEVELSLLGDDGNTLVSERIEDSKSVRVNRGLLKLTETHLDHTSVPYPQIRSFDETPLVVSKDYVRSVINGKPLLYWRFEGTDERRFANEISSELPAAVHTVKQSAESVRIANGHVRFSRSTASRFLSLEGELPGLNEGEYTIEFWMNPDDLTHSTCVGIQPQSEPPAKTHLNVIEIATATFLIHEPGAIRFLHRNPPEEKSQLGTNAFSQGICIPHQWQHVVAVKNLDSLELFFNGKLARRVDLANSSGHGSYRLLIGQLKAGTTERQFSGAIDELAIYPRSLTAAEIALHHAMIVGQK